MGGVVDKTAKTVASVAVEAEAAPTGPIPEAVAMAATVEAEAAQAHDSVATQAEQPDQVVLAVATVPADAVVQPVALVAVPDSVVACSTTVAQSLRFT